MQTIILALSTLALLGVAAVTEPAPRRVAIIGAGPAGSAAAYFLQQESAKRGSNIDIAVFERSGLVGGRVRSSTVTYNNRTLHFELGASMFVGSNKHMYDLAKQFNLTLCSHPCTFGADNKAAVLQSKLSGLGEYGIWDVAKGVWQVKRDGWFWVDALKMLWRYRGLGDMRHVRMRTDMALREFLTSYEEFGNATRVYRSWDEYLAQRPYMKMSLYYKALEYYVSAGERVRRRFLDEVVTLATRVNYMQDIDTINLLSAHVSMAPTSEDVYSVAGGNWQVFDRMIRESRATLNFNTTITAVQREGGKYTLALGSNQTTAAFDSVIIAAPLSVSGLDVLGQKDVPVKYVTMYVTFAIGVLRPGFFPPGTIPQLTVTTYHTTAPFNCLSILACLDDALACHQGTVLVKIFSHEPVDLDAVFERVEWQREQRWHSYPQLIPRNARYVQENGDHAYRSDRPGMPPIVMDEHAGGGVYYVNGMESLFSTMESQTVAARHVVQLVVLGKGGFDSVRMAGADEPA